MARRLVVSLLFVGWGLGPGMGASWEHWKLEGNLLSANGGAALTAGVSKPATAAEFSFGTDDIGGQPAHFLGFSRGTIFQLSHRLGANALGTRVNQYTLILDVRFDGSPTGWSALLQTDSLNRDATDWAINGSRSLGSVGSFGGKVADGTWNRIALVVDASAGSYTSYLNGKKVQEMFGIEWNGRYSLGPVLWLFADASGFNSAGRVADIQLRDYPMSSAELALLGSVTPAGIPPIVPPVLQITQPADGVELRGGTLQVVEWTVQSPQGTVMVRRGRDLLGSVVLGTAPMVSGRFEWPIPPWHPDAENQRIYLTTPADGEVLATSGVFRIRGTVPPLSPGFDAVLGRNLGFEENFSGWTIVKGRPIIGSGDAHSGSRYLYGGNNNPGDAIVRQEVDLVAAGFRTGELDDEPMVEAAGWMRVETGSGAFDDHVFHRVQFLGGAGEVLGEVRSLIADSWQWLPRTVSAPAPKGTRRLALEVVGRQRRGTSNDAMADDLALRIHRPWPPSAVRITKQPFLQDVRPDAMTLFWETDANPVWPAVEWGDERGISQVFTRIETLQIDATHFVHRATLEGLERESMYRYRVRNGTVVSPEYRFRTAPRTETPFAVAWWGDNHQGTTVLRQHVANLLAHGPDLICVAGDMVNSGNNLDEWHDYWFKPLEHLNCAQTTPVMFARGNHDAEHAYSYAYSKLPGNEAWFAFDYGNTRFIFLDTEVHDAVSPEQFQWLQAELARPETRRAAFRVVCFHRPPWCQLWNGGGHTGEVWVREAWVPLFRQAGVDLVICGHEHDYHRGRKDGVIYIVSGGGGGALDTERVANWSHVEVESSRYHFDLMSVTGKQLSWETFDTGNRLIDAFVLRSRVPALEIARDPGPTGGWRVTVEGREALNYVLEASLDLRNWEPVSTWTMGTGETRRSQRFEDATQRYFRARWVAQ